MVKINETIIYKKVEYRRVSLTYVKKNLNKMIFALPCNANIYSPWIEFFTYYKNDGVNFDSWRNQVEYYNCNNEIGRYLHYYIKA